MIKENPSAGHDLPKARVRRRKWRVSVIWVVPIVAAAVAAYLVYQQVREFSTVITIQFRTSGGVRPGETPVRYRGADIGQVSAVTLSPDQRYARVQVKLRRFAAPVARAGSVFWIVRPQLSMGDLSGLGTIITGPYIEVSPGRGKPAKEFVGVENSPAILDPQGLNVVLLCSEAGSLRAGVPVYYRGIEVGTVRDTRLSANASAVQIDIVIRRRYAALVRNGSRFWNVTGLDLRIGLLHGAEINMESLKSLLIGGIAFATPEDPNARPVQDGAVFPLAAQPQKEWLGWAPQIPIPASDNDLQEAKRETKSNLPFPPRSPP